MYSSRADGLEVGSTISPKNDSAVIKAEGLTRYFRVRLDGDGFAGRIHSFLRPQYRVVKALDGVTFQVNGGESVGYIGLNGAGKSTTIKLLCGVLVPTSGTVHILGAEPYRNRVPNARKIGLMMGQRTQLLWDLPVKESFSLLGKVYDLSPTHYRTNVERLVASLDIGALWDTPARMLSLGQKTRCDLALTFLHNPSVVFLDEPTIGLDVFARDSIRAFLNHEKSRGTTIFMASHDLDDLEIVSDRVILLHQGKLLFDGAQETLKGLAGKQFVSLEDTVKQFYNATGGAKELNAH